MSEAYPFEIRDADDAAAESPHTFFIPSRDERVAIDIGDIVKLGFEYLWDIEEYGGERMWVKVTGKRGLRYVGVLDNEPWEKGLEVGLELEFGIEHILDIDWAIPENHPPRVPHRTYYERCMVDDCVVEDGVRVEYLYREQPDMGEEGDAYPDSGWRIRGEQGEQSDAEMENRSASYLALGVVLNRDDSFLHLLDEPEGAAFMRNFETCGYDRLD